MRSSADDDRLNPRTSTIDGSPGGLHSEGNLEGKRPRGLHQSPRADFDSSEVIFENVCLPSPLLSCRLTPSGRRKTLPGASPLTHRRSPRDIPLKNTDASQHGFASPGHATCRQEVGFRGRGEPMTDINARLLRGMIDVPSGEHVVECVARGAASSNDVINHGAPISIGSSQTHANRSDDGSDITSTAIGCCVAKALQTKNANANAAAGRCCKASADANAAGHLLSSRRTTSSESINSQNPTRLLLVTDLDAFEDDHLLTHATASIAAHSNPNSSSRIAGQQLSSSSAAEVLWELSGHKLSDICQTLITDCGRFVGQSESPAGDAPMASVIDAAAAGAVGDQTRRQHPQHNTLADDVYRFPEFPTRNSEPSASSNTSRSLSADNGLFLDGSMIRRSNSNDGVGSPPKETKLSTDLPHYSPSIGEGSHRFDSGGIDAFTVDLTKRSSEWSLGIRSIPASPLRFAPRANSASAPLTDDALTTRHSTSANTRGATGKVSLETAIDSDDEVFAERKGSDKEDKSPAEDFKGDGRREENNSTVSRSSGGRRGRTMERSKYDKSLLKDFIKPEFKKFSLPPTSSSQDLDLDTELAIWELSDFVPDRHRSAPPAADATMQVAKSDDLLLRSRQASVSPLRTRISGSGLSPRWIRGCKSVEMLTSRNASPGRGRMSRRTLSKEWQIVTLTTREEITTTIRPKSVDHSLQILDKTSGHTTESELLTSNSAASTAGSGHGTQNLRTLHDSNQFKLGENRVGTDVERNVDERNIQVAVWNEETNDGLRVETDNMNSSHTQIDNVLKASVDESNTDTENQTLSVRTNIKQQRNGDTVQSGLETKGEIQVERLGGVSADQLKSTDSDSAYSFSVPHKTEVNNKGLNPSDELSSALSSSGLSKQPEQVALDSSSGSGAQNPDEVAFWTIITEALSEMMKEVQLAENATPSTTEDATSATTNDAQETKEPEQQHQSSTASVYDEGDSLQIVEASDTDNGFISDNLENCETPDPLGVDIDALVQALLYFANEGAIVESMKASGTESAPEKNAQSSSKESNHEIVKTINKTLLPASSCSRDPSNETTITDTTGSELNPIGSGEEAILGTCCSGSPLPRRTDASDVLVGFEEEEDKSSAENLLCQTTRERTVFDDGISVENFDAESFLEIREESDGLYSSSSEHAEMHSSLSESQIGHTVARESVSHSDSLTRENSACSDDTVRQRTVSKQTGAQEVTSMRRSSDSGELFPEKAFLESLFSSLGKCLFVGPTIVILKYVLVIVPR